MSAQMPALFRSHEAFRRGFESGLAALLDEGTLNLFILVAANASFDARLFAALRQPLERRYRQLLEQFREAFAGGRRVDEADDDLLVFLKMAAIGFDRLAVSERRRAGPWEVQFNHLRAFRPMRNSQRAMTTIHQPFDAAAFNFNRPFIQQERVWSGRLLDTPVDLYYNKYPFVDLHCLLVPEREACLAQYQRPEMHAFVWQLVRTLADNLPGIRIGYNAMGAFASVNHLHYQLFVRERGLPVEHRDWRHNGGTRDYPVTAYLLDDCERAWNLIERLHTGNHAYNLLYMPRGMYCMVREKQGGFELAEWSNGLSWYEMCGAVMTFNQQDYRALAADRIHADLAKASVAAGDDVQA